MTDKFEDLRTYVTVVTCGGVNAAAAELGVAKSAVSRRLSDLEARLGVTLVDRTTRSFEVTAIGREYFRRAKGILDTLGQLDDGIGASTDEPTISISAPLPVLVHLVAPAIARISARAAISTVRLVGEDAAASADIVVGLGGPAEEGVERRELARVQRTVFASPGYLEAMGSLDGPSDLAEHRGVAITSAGEEDWRLSGNAPRPPAIALTVPDEEVALAATVAGLGLAQLSDFVAADALREGRLAIALKTGPRSASALSLSHAVDVAPAVRRLADELVRESRSR